MQRYHFGLFCLFLSLALLGCGVRDLWRGEQANPAISVDWHVPAELNPPFTAGTPPSGGAPNATPDQAAEFAWQEFIALNWPAGPQEGKPSQRDMHSPIYKFGDPKYNGPLVWQTFRGKVEIFPGKLDPNNRVGPDNAPVTAPPPGYPGPSGDTSYGYDALPQYNYQDPVPVACDQRQASDPTPWINLDETDQINLDNMYAGVVDAASSPGNSAPQLVRFLAKANRAQYVYVARNSNPDDPSKLWWYHIPQDVVADTRAYLLKYKASPPSGSANLVSLPDGTIEIKAGWRPLNLAEAASGRFHTQIVRFYEMRANGGASCFRDAVWGLISLHIIQKTPSAPYFIYATFEQADNLLTADGKTVEDADGNIVAATEPQTATSPQLCLKDPEPAIMPPPADGREIISKMGSISFTSDTSTCPPAPTEQYCSIPGRRLYYHNEKAGPQPLPPLGGNICVNKRDNAIPDYVIKANAQAHTAIADYLKRNGIASAPWLTYKLINVQYFPYDKKPNPNIPNGSLYTAQPPYTAKNPAPSSFYQANIVVETNRALQLFSGGLTPNLNSDWNADGAPHKNMFYNGSAYNMGGCMGCHGSQGQNPLGTKPEKDQAGDFSVILARGIDANPETPVVAPPSNQTSMPRNRSIMQ